MKNKNFKYCSLLILLTVAIVMMVPPIRANSLIPSRTYTFDADFDEGDLIGVEHDTVPDQLQLSKETTTLPFIWVPNNEGTVSKVNTETGDEVGRYKVAPYAACSPSRTTVDLKGNCYVGNRQAGTVVKIGLFEAGEWIDRNENGICDTSQDLDNNGDITGAEILPWGQDECVLYEISLVAGSEGTYVPGTYPGPYDSNYWGTAPRGLAIDANNNLWAGTSRGSKKFFYIDGSTGAILKTVNSPYESYGAVIDKYGHLWSSGGSSGWLGRLNTTTNVLTWLYLGHYVYGIGLDYKDHLFVSGWQNRKLTRIDITTATIDWTKYYYNLDYQYYQARGVVCTSDNHTWVACTYYDRVFRFDNDGNIIARINVGNAPTGVSVDDAGNVWVCSSVIQRINTTTNTVTLTKSILGSAGHYSYSDMTGIVARTITTKTGTWNTTFDSGAVDTPWGKISWTSDEPQGTSVKVQVRSSNDQSSWSAWETAENDIALVTTPEGRYLQIETTLQIVSGEVSPILYDLTVQIGYLPVVIDIKPGSDPNSVNLGEQGVLPVAILGSSDFDVTNIDPSSIEIGGISVDLRGSPKRPKLAYSYEDVNGDNYVDLVAFFNILDLADAGVIIETTTSLTLAGSLYDGTLIRGTDNVRIVPP